MPTPGESKAALQLITGAAVTAVTTALGRLTGSPEEQRAVLLEAVPGVVAYYSDGSSALAADFYDDQRDRAAPPKLYLAEPIILDRTEKLRRAVAWASDPLFADNRELSSARLADVVQLETARPYRDTILTNRRRDPSAVGWRRVTNGGCKLCRMLADRGAVYSDQTARFATHGHCKCTAQPVFSTDDFGEEASVMQYMASKKRRTPEQQAKLREYLNTHYSTGGAGVQTSAASRAKVAGPSPTEVTSRLRAQLASLETSLPALKIRAANGDSVSAPIKWQTERIAELRRQLGAK
jgi:hypothetical protein